MSEILQPFLTADKPITPDIPYEEKFKIAFSIGSLDITWYGLGYLFAFVVGITLVCLKLWKVYKLNIDVFYYFCIIGIPVGIFGGRFWSCMLGYPAGGNWSEFFNFRMGGMAIEGGVVAVLLLAFIYFPIILSKPKYQKTVEMDLNSTGEKKTFVKKVSMMLYLDAIAGVVPLSHFIGRWGNYMNQELYGNVVTDHNYQEFLSHALPFMYVWNPVEGIGEWRHPLFLYEGLANVVGFFLLFIGYEFIKSTKFRRDGDLTILYFIWYGILRLIMEPLRHSDFASVNTIILSSMFVGFGLVLLVLNHTVFVKMRKVSIILLVKNYWMYLKQNYNHKNKIAKFQKQKQWCDTKKDVQVKKVIEENEKLHNNFKKDVWEQSFFKPNEDIYHRY
ncbi:MAG: prolipoprotein diacylglyceryl transferase [Mycoplasmataceae bacterium]|nr:prolipoprotein diacylglyceryl transferase [Mycoplasmataceae bacterium]